MVNSMLKSTTNKSNKLSLEIYWGDFTVSKFLEKLGHTKLVLSKFALFSRYLLSLEC